jgi:hypothetical protein
MMGKHKCSRIYLFFLELDNVIFFCFLFFFRETEANMQERARVPWKITGSGRPSGQCQRIGVLQIAV